MCSWKFVYERSPLSLESRQFPASIPRAASTSLFLQICISSISILVVLAPVLPSTPWDVQWETSDGINAVSAPLKLIELLLQLLLCTVGSEFTYFFPFRSRGSEAAGPPCILEDPLVSFGCQVLSSSPIRIISRKLCKSIFNLLPLLRKSPHRRIWHLVRGVF